MRNCLQTALYLAICGAGAAYSQIPCEQLRSVSLPQTTITAVESVTASPAHCRIMAVIAPTSDSHIEMELWLPAAGWNGKFEAVGNGGWAGSINTRDIASAVREGYASASTDTGHKSAETPGGSFALGHPEKLIDYGYRAIHEMTLRSRSLIAAFYGHPLQLSYWNGCSNGGRQGLMEAQRYPDDFDGVVAGAPAANWSGRAMSSLAVAQAVHKDEASYIPPAKYPILHDAVLQACDALDGVKDGTLEDPLRCQFDPAVLQCQNGDGPACLTAPQVEAARRIYAAGLNSAKQEYFPGLEPGSELGWATYGGSRPFSIGEDFFRFVVFQDPAWSFRSLNFDTAVVMARRMEGGIIDALNPDLQKFFARGGKLIQYHGWSDPQIPPMHSVEYYRSVVKAMSATKIQQSYRLFMVPGMAHCGGGSGPNQFNAMAALERWRESGAAPDQLIASRVTNNQVESTRPLCPFPLVARYRGVGNTKDAASFVCGPAGAAKSQ